MAVVQHGQDDNCHSRAAFTGAGRPARLCLITEEQQEQTEPTWNVVLQHKR